MEHLNFILYTLTGALALVEISWRWLWPREKRSPRWAGWMETVDSFFVALVIALGLHAVWVQPFNIPSGSMEDTLMTGDYILVKRYEYGYSLWNCTARFLEFHKPQRGDVVVFVYPKDHSVDFIKRCVGVPGDVILYRDKVLYVNGTRQEEPYARHIFPDVRKTGNPMEPAGDPGSPTENWATSSRDNFGPVTVEAGHYFMMGDNRDNSLDSRYWGQLDEKLIKGKAWFVYWHALGFLPDLRRMFTAIR